MNLPPQLRHWSVMFGLGSDVASPVIIALVGPVHGCCGCRPPTLSSLNCSSSFRWCVSRSCGGARPVVDHVHRLVGCQLIGQVLDLLRISFRHLTILRERYVWFRRCCGGCCCLGQTCSVDKTVDGRRLALNNWSNQFLTQPSLNGEA